MKIVALAGSCRLGNTFAMVEAACRALQNLHDVKLIHLKDATIGPCDGCLACDESGACVIDDAMLDVIGSIADADGLIIGTPARWGLLSGELKVFIDRLNPLAVPEKLKGKKAVIFAVGQSSPERGESVQLARDSVAHFCHNAGIEVVESVLAYECLGPTDLHDKMPEVLAACEKAGHSLVRSMETSRV